METMPWTENVTLASKAVSLTSHIQHERSIDILAMAATSNQDIVRLSAAVGVRNLRIPSTNKVLEILKEDRNHEVKRLALDSIEILKLK